jgi:hypothetical protein
MYDSVLSFLAFIDDGRYSRMDYNDKLMTRSKRESRVMTNVAVDFSELHA